MSFNAFSDSNRRVFGVFFAVFCTFLLTKVFTFLSLGSEVFIPIRLWVIGLLFDLAASAALSVGITLLWIVVNPLPALYSRAVRLLSFLFVPLVQVMAISDQLFFNYSGIRFDQAFWHYLNLKNIWTIKSSIIDQFTNLNACILLFLGIGTILAGIVAALPIIRSGLRQPAQTARLTGMILGIGLTAILNATRMQAGWVNHYTGLGRNVIITNLSQLFNSEKLSPPLPEEVHKFWNTTAISHRDLPISEDYPWIRRNKSPQMCQTAIGEKRKNLIFISLESFGALSVSTLSPYYKHTTPEFDQLSKEGTLFTRAFMSSLPTMPGLVSSVCSTYGLVDESDHSKNNRQLRCSASVLSDHGYRTGFIVNSSRDFDRMYPFFTENGFFEFIGEEDFQFSPTVPRIPGQFSNYQDPDLYRKALSWIDSNPLNQPFFLTIVTTSNHDPFPDYGPQFRSEEGTGKRQRLHGSMRFSDQALGDFFRELKKRPSYSDTVIFIYADHPSWFHEKPGESPSANDPFLNSWIPLLVMNPVGLNPGTRIDWITSHADITPTALEMLGICETHAFMGQSLLDKSIPPEKRYSYTLAKQFEKTLWIQDNQGVAYHPGAQNAAFYDMSRFPHDHFKGELPLSAPEIKEGVEKINSVTKLLQWSRYANRIWNSTFKQSESK